MIFIAILLLGLTNTSDPLTRIDRVDYIEFNTVIRRPVKKNLEQTIFWDVGKEGHPEVVSYRFGIELKNRVQFDFGKRKHFIFWHEGYKARLVYFYWYEVTHTLYDPERKNVLVFETCNRRGLKR